MSRFLVTALLGTRTVLCLPFLLLACGGEGSKAKRQGQHDTSRDAAADANVANDGGAATDATLPLTDAQEVAQGEWEELKPMPELARFYVGSAAARGLVFIVGGLSDDGPESRAVQAYDPAKDSWSTLPDLPRAFQMPNVAAVGDRLFVLGALSVPDALEYDFEAKVWVPRAPLPYQFGTGGAAVATSGKKVLISGGIRPGVSANRLNTGVRLAGTYAYDTTTDTWEELPRLPLPVGYAMGAVIGNEFWVIGGSTDRARTSQVTALDLESKTWADKPTLPVSVSSGAAGVIDGKIYVAGGIASSTGVISAMTTSFDPARNMWLTHAPMTAPRFGIAGAVLDDQLYVATGMSGQGETFAPVADMNRFSP